MRRDRIGWRWRLGGWGSIVEGVEAGRVRVGEEDRDGRV